MDYTGLEILKRENKILMDFNQEKKIVKKEGFGIEIKTNMKQLFAFYIPWGKKRV